MVIAKFSCKDCTKREVGCHAWCEDYIKEKAEHEKAKAVERLERSKDAMRIDVVERHTTRKLKRTKRAQNGLRH